MKALERYRPFLPFASLSLIGAAALVFGTRWGIGLGPDSASYIGAARNLLSGHGLSISTPSGEFAPVTRYPPLFSALLAVVGLVGVDPIKGVRWLHAALFGANVFLVGHLVWSYGGSARASFFASFLMMTSVISLQVHSMAWSEPLFVFLVLLVLLSLGRYLKRPRRSSLVASSIMAALAALTRYAGVAVIAAGVLSMLLWSIGAWNKRCEKAFVFLLISAAPLSLWLSRNLAIGATATAREIGFHPVTVGHLEAALDSVATWLLPEAAPSAGRAGLLAVLILLALVFSWRGERRGGAVNNTTQTGC